MASSLAIAYEFVQAALSEKRVLTPLALIKLTYLAHGWSLGMNGRGLVDEPAEAWQYGPVYPQLYRFVRDYRGNPVPADFVSPDMFGGRVDEKDRQFIKAVYDNYKEYSGTQLSALTHQSGTPWDSTWNKHGKNSVISNGLIEAHYKDKLAAQGAS